MSYVLRMEREYSDFEQRRALEEFHKAVDGGAVDRAHDELFIQELGYCPSLALLTNLADTFNNADEDFSEDLFYFLGCTVRRRDSEMMHLLAGEFYEPYSQYRGNERFREKVQQIIDGKADPGLKLIK